MKALLGLLTVAGLALVVVNILLPATPTAVFYPKSSLAVPVTTNEHKAPLATTPASAQTIAGRPVITTNYPNYAGGNYDFPTFEPIKIDPLPPATHASSPSIYWQPNPTPACHVAWGC